jgi:hypothetical protein
MLVAIGIVYLIALKTIATPARSASLKGFKKSGSLKDSFKTAL